MEQAFGDTLLKYQPLVSSLDSLGYRCKLVALIVGRLGHVHRLTVCGLQIAGLPKTKEKQLAWYCSVSAVMGSLAVGEQGAFCIFKCPCIQKTVEMFQSFLNVM